MDEIDLLAMAGCDEEAALLLVCESKEKMHSNSFNLDKLDDENLCLQYFRFEKAHIISLKEALNLPDMFKCIQGTQVSGLEALCVLLRRLAYPNRLSDLCVTFGRSESELSLIFNETLNRIYEEHQHRLTDLEQAWIRPDEFAQAIQDQGAPLGNVWGFIDGTVRPICRPKHHQQLVYNGHKRTHALKFQAVVAPNGLIANLFGPFEGRRHDSALLEASNLLPAMETPKYEGFALYGDPACPLREKMLVPFRGANITPQQEEFNKAMSKVRESVEWGFKDIITLFAFLDFKKKPENIPTTSGEVLHCRCFVDQLSHLPVW